MTETEVIALLRQAIHDAENGPGYFEGDEPAVYVSESEDGVCHVAMTIEAAVILLSAAAKEKP